jgi:hypothetical protein
VDELAAALLAAGLLPAKAKADAVHLAMASVYRLDYLLTWNLRHLANATILARLRPVVEQVGSVLPLKRCCSGWRKGSCEPTHWATARAASPATANWFRAWK